MAEELLREYIREALMQELHIDPKMKAVVAGRFGVISMTQLARGKGLALRWALERGLSLTPEMESLAGRLLRRFTQKYGREVAPAAVVQALDRRYNSKHVGSEPDAPTGGRGSEGGRSERGDDSEAPQVVRDGRTL